MQFQDLKTVLGIELKFVNDKEFSCRYCIILKNKNSLSISTTKVIDDTLSVILEALPKAFPVALTLTGKGVVHKQVLLTAETDLMQLFQVAYPAIEENEFYIQQVVEQERALISLVRKQTADELIGKMQRSGLSIFTLSFGAIVSAPIWSQLNSYGTEILFDGHIFKLNDSHQWLSYQNDPTLINQFQSKIGEQVINEQNILAYASAFQLILYQQLDLICANVEVINTQFLQFTQNRSLKQKALLCLTGLLGALLISYGIYSYYDDKNAALMQKVGTYTANTDQMEQLSRNSSENQKVLKQLNWNGGYNYGFLLHEIGQSIPKQLQLQEVAINNDKQLTDTLVNTPNIKINGVTDNLTALNNWIFVLKQKSWIKTVRLLKYEESVEAENYKFNLILNY